MLIQELSSGLVLDILFGRSSDFYTKAYNEGLIDESFSYDFTMEKGFGFAMVGSDTEQPEELETAIRKTIRDAVENWSITDVELDRMRKKKIGQFMRSLNSPEFIANQFTRYAFNKMNLFDVVPTLEKMTVGNLQDAFATFSDDDGAHSLYNYASRTCAMTERRYCVVLGASGGIGKAICRSLAASGWSLYLHYNVNKEEVEDLQSELMEAYPQSEFQVCTC